MNITNFVVSQREKALLVGDYGSYRKQLSRRLLVVRKKLNYTSPKGRKYVSKAPVTAENIASNHEYAWFLSCIAYAYDSPQVHSLTPPHIRASLGTSDAYEVDTFCRRSKEHHRVHEAAHWFATEQSQYLCCTVGRLAQGSGSLKS